MDEEKNPPNIFRPAFFKDGRILQNGFVTDHDSGELVRKPATGSSVVSLHDRNINRRLTRKRVKPPKRESKKSENDGVELDHKERLNISTLKLCFY